MTSLQQEEQDRIGGVLDLKTYVLHKFRDHEQYMKLKFDANELKLRDFE